MKASPSSLIASEAVGTPPLAVVLCRAERGYQGGGRVVLWGQAWGQQGPDTGREMGSVRSRGGNKTVTPQNQQQQKKDSNFFFPFSLFFFSCVFFFFFCHFFLLFACFFFFLKCKKLSAARERGSLDRPFIAKEKRQLKVG